METLDLVVVVNVRIIDHLGILETGAIKEINKAHILLLAMVANPAPQQHFLTRQRLQAFLQLSCGNHVHALFRSSCASLRNFVPCMIAQARGRSKGNRAIHLLVPCPAPAGDFYNWEH